MQGILTGPDIILFVGTLAAVMALGLFAGRHEKTAEDYFLAGRDVRWWGVAASIFGSNVSANHIVGMLGIGYSVGFAQSHFELGAIAGLMLLCYGFLPVYRKLNVFTLSEYLSRRYDERSRLLYALLMVIIMVLVQMVPAFYIGSRSMNLMLAGSPLQLGYEWGIVAMAVVAGAYTIVGGLKAVIWTDVIQSVLLLGAGIVVAVSTFSQPEIGGWGELMATDRAADAKMRLYLPADHPELPWTGVLTGLMVLHFFYWGTNQFIVQRALAARSDAESRLGIIAAGFFKLLIPFFAIGTGIAAYYLFPARGLNPDPDAAFPELVRLVIPLGYGIVGLIAAGLIGAILSSIDSMMNSAATIVTVDVYQRYVAPQASDRQLILVGRVSIFLFVSLAALLAIVALDPESTENFFLVIVDQQSHLVPGVLVAFALGMFWRRATATGAFLTILLAPAISFALPRLYQKWLLASGSSEPWLGTELNMLHRVALTVLASIVLHMLVSLGTPGDPEKQRLVWTDLGGHTAKDLRRLCLQIALSLGVFAALAVAITTGVFIWLTPTTAAVMAACWTMTMYLIGAGRAIAQHRDVEQPPSGPPTLGEWLREDRVWAGVLTSLAIFMMFYFF